MLRVILNRNEIFILVFFLSRSKKFKSFKLLHSVFWMLIAIFRSNLPLHQRRIECQTCARILFCRSSKLCPLIRISGLKFAEHFSEQREYIHFLPVCARGRTNECSNWPKLDRHTAPFDYDSWDCYTKETSFAYPISPSRCCRRRYKQLAVDVRLYQHI